jgi:hypothetical protein
VRLAYYIPNLFRYRTERELYRLFAVSRGLKAQRKYFMGLEETIETMIRETSSMVKERADWRITWTLVALGAIQIAGVLAALAALEDAQYRYLWWHHNWSDIKNFFVEAFNGHILPPDPRFHLWAVWALWATFLVLGGGLLAALTTGIRAASRYGLPRGQDGRFPRRGSSS